MHCHHQQLETLVSVCDEMEDTEPSCFQQSLSSIQEMHHSSEQEVLGLQARHNEVQRSRRVVEDEQARELALLE